MTPAPHQRLTRRPAGLTAARIAAAIALVTGTGCGSPDEPSFADLAAPTDGAPPTDAPQAPPDLRSRPVLRSPAEASDTDPAPNIVHIRLVAAPHRFEVGGATIDGMAYNGQIPGPTIRARLGDQLIVDLDNQLPADTTIHWHGLRVPYAMDGVTWQHSPIGPGKSFRYQFPLTQTGTFWYHPHFDSHLQINRGLYGVLIVEDPAEPRTDAELIVVLDAFDEEGAGPGHDETTRTWTVNREVLPVAQLTGGQAVRLRILNASNGGYVDLRQPAMRQIASDQGLLAKLRLPESLVLGPGDRAELEWLVGEAGFEVRNAPYSAHGGAAFGTPTEVFVAAVQDPRARPGPQTLEILGKAPTVDPRYSDIVWVLQGAGDRWFINGEVFPDITIERLALGADAIFEVRNLSASEHPFHLHGYAFEVLSLGGKPVSELTLEDTVNIPTYGTLRFRLRADNPGDWMAHCHILSHAEGGMMTVLRVGTP